MGRFVELNNRENQKKEKAPASGGGRFVQIGDTSKIGAYTGIKFGQVEKKSAPTTGASPQKKPASAAGASPQKKTTPAAAPAKKQSGTQTPRQSQFGPNAQTSAGFQRDIDDLNAKALAISREKERRFSGVGSEFQCRIRRSVCPDASPARWR